MVWVGRVLRDIIPLETLPPFPIFSALYFFHFKNQHNADQSISSCFFVNSFLFVVLSFVILPNFLLWKLDPCDPQLFCRDTHKDDDFFFFFLPLDNVLSQGKWVCCLILPYLTWNHYRKKSPQWWFEALLLSQCNRYA